MRCGLPTPTTPSLALFDTGRQWISPPRLSHLREEDDIAGLCLDLLDEVGVRLVDLHELRHRHVQLVRAWHDSQAADSWRGIRQLDRDDDQAGVRAPCRQERYVSAAQPGRRTTKVLHSPSCQW